MFPRTYFSSILTSKCTSQYDEVFNIKERKKLRTFATGFSSTNCFITFRNTWHFIAMNFRFKTSLYHLIYRFLLSIFGFVRQEIKNWCQFWQLTATRRMHPKRNFVHIVVQRISNDFHHRHSPALSLLPLSCNEHMLIPLRQREKKCVANKRHKFNKKTHRIFRLLLFCIERLFGIASARKGSNIFR